MLDDEHLGRIADLLAAVRDDATAAMPWSAIGPMAALSAGGLDVTIDFRATARLGAPLLLARARDDTHLLALMSSREQEVARCIRRGLTNKMIAHNLRISIGTVKDHVHHILSKTGCASRAELAARLGGARDEPSPTRGAVIQSIKG